jgi:hypothetical protein
MCLAACGGGGGGAADPPATGGGTGAGTSRLYIGWYAEDPANNPEDPTIGALLLRVPAADGGFAGQMPFSFVGCSAGVDTGSVSGSRTGTALAGQWAGALDLVTVGGAFQGQYNATADTWAGSYTNAAGKVAVGSSGGCHYAVAPSGSFKLYGNATADPADFVLTAGSGTTPTLSWTARSGAAAYGVRVFDWACLQADVTQAACFLGEAYTSGTSISYPAAFAGATALQAGREVLAIVTSQSASSAFLGFASARFTPVASSSGGGGSAAYGTLALSGTAAGLAASFPAGTRVGPSDTGPSCSGSGASMICGANRLLSWVAQAGSTGVLGVTMVGYAGTAPGPAPGEGLSTLDIAFEVEPGNAARRHALSCILPGFYAQLLGSSTCASLNAVGVTVDNTARTLTFRGTTLRSTSGTTVILDGTLQF